MKRTTYLSVRTVFVFVVSMIALFGLTSCDSEADHYYVIFGPITPADPGSSCATYCMATSNTISNGYFDVARGDVVRFVNFTQGTVNVTLVYTYPDGSASTDSFALDPGKSRDRKIKQNLPAGGTQIEFRYDTGAPPALGGPTMIVRP